MTPLIDPKHLATLREMSDAYQRGQVPQWKRDRAIALEQAVAAIERGEKARAELQSLANVYADKLAAERKEFRALEAAIESERRVYAEQLDEARRRGREEALASLPENTQEATREWLASLALLESVQEVANDQP